MDYAKLADALREANAASMRASRDTPDGGTCNLDSLVLRVPKGTRDRAIRQAATIAGVPVTDTNWFGRGYFLCLDAIGQGNSREAGIRAARKILERHGFEISYYAQVD